MMNNRICYKKICTIVPIIIAINLIHSPCWIGGHGLPNSRNISTPRYFTRGKDAQLQLDKSKSSAVATARHPTQTIVQSSDNPLKSRFKKTGVVLTLSLRPKGQVKMKGKVEVPEVSPTAAMTSKISDLTEASFKIPRNNTRKPYTILDRLRTLTNSKMRESSGTNYGFKNHQSNRDDDKHEKSDDIDKPDPGKTFTTKVGGHLSHSLPNHEFKSKPTITVVIQPTTLPSVDLELVTDNTNSSEKLQVGSSELDEEQIEHEETRFITADQIGGNRPTKMPFHFTTTTTQATTTPVAVKRQLKRYPKLHSPHNHIYAPTQDPINIPHNDKDLSVQDVQDYRAAHLTFGSKVGSDIPTENPKSTLPLPPIHKIDTVTRPSVQRSLTSRSPTPPKKTTVHPQSASSGVKKSHIKIKPRVDSVNDNLPFYKEPGGVFEQKYSDNENEPNEVNQRFDDRAPGVKYAPKGPSKQPQQQINYNNVNSQLYQNTPLQPQHQQRHFNNPVTSPQYVTVTQQPIYLAPVPVQQAVHQGYNGYPTQNPSVQPNYYPQHQHQHQHQHQQPYYPAPVQPPPTHSHAPQYHAQNQPHYNPTPTVATTPTGPAYHVPYPNQQPIYVQSTSPQNDPNRFVHLNQPQTTPDYASQNIYNPPPSRYDPASDYYYGDPRPPKLKSKPPAAPRGVRPSKNRDDDYQDSTEKYEKPKKYNGNRGSKQNSRRERERDTEPEKYNDKYDGDGDKDDEDEDNSNKSPRSKNNSPRNNRDDYDHADDNDDTRSVKGRNSGGREKNSPRRQSKRPGYDDYDTDPNENIGEFVRPAERSHRAYNDRRPSQEFGNLDKIDGGNDRQFIPSERDNNFRPSPPDNGPNFDHPNIEYPERRSQPQQQQQRPQNREDYDNDGERFDTRLPPLDPIYTRTLQQYDEENTAPRNRGNNHEEEPEVGYPLSPFEGHEEQYPPSSQRGRSKERRPPPPPPPNEEEDEDEDQPQEGHQNERGQKRPQNDDDEEDDNQSQGEKEKPPENQSDDEEETEEEEPQEKPQRENEQKPQEDEEEEEEEEEEESNNNKRKSKRQPKEEKKPPPEKPKPDKTGNLDDDISGIEKEFGFTVPPLTHS